MEGMGGFITKEICCDWELKGGWDEVMVSWCFFIFPCFGLICFLVYIEFNSDSKLKKRTKTSTSSWLWNFCEAMWCAFWFESCVVLFVVGVGDIFRYWSLFFSLWARKPPFGSSLLFLTLTKKDLSPCKVEAENFVLLGWASPKTLPQCQWNFEEGRQLISAPINGVKTGGFFFHSWIFVWGCLSPLVFGAGKVGSECMPLWWVELWKGTRFAAWCSGSWGTLYSLCWRWESSEGP